MYKLSRVAHRVSTRLEIIDKANKMLNMLYKEDIKKYDAYQVGKWVKQGRYNLTPEELKKCEVFKVAHHGSKYSNSQILLERVCPGLALISCSGDNSYGHPHKETLKRLEAVGCKIMTTAESGAVKIRIGKKIEVYGFVK